MKSLLKKVSSRHLVIAVAMLAVISAFVYWEQARMLCNEKFQHYAYNSSVYNGLYKSCMRQRGF